MADLALSAAREVKRLDKLGLLARGEVLCEVEASGVGTRPGALIVTDQRVIFLSTTLVRRRTRVISVRLQEIARVESSSELRLGREWGVLTLSLRTPSPVGDEQVRFEAIPGGQARADELARTILRQRDYLDRPSQSARLPNGDVLNVFQEQEIDDLAQRITVGRGVASYINAHGGRLYVWGDPVGGFDWMKAHTEPPEGVDFVHVGGVTDFELFVEEGVVIARRLRLERRWWHPRGGIAVDTGLVIGP